MSDTALVPVTEYALSRIEGEGISELLRQNLGDGGLTLTDLDVLKVPAGGSAVWELPTPDGDIDAQPTFSGIIVHFRDARRYWATPFGEAEQGPPDCSSNDGRIGLGEPGGDCSKCPLAEFGSAENKRAQACKALRQLAVIQRDSILPLLVNVPPTSLRPCRQYMTRLTSGLLFYWHVETEFGLETVPNATGTRYSRITMRRVRVLDDEERNIIAAYRNGLIPVLQDRAVADEDFVSESE